MNVTTHLRSSILVLFTGGASGEGAPLGLARRPYIGRKNQLKKKMVKRTVAALVLASGLGLLAPTAASANKPVCENQLIDVLHGNTCVHLPLP